MGTLSVVIKNNRGEQRVIVKDAGVVDYMKGEVILNTINITSTVSQIILLKFKHSQNQMMLLD